MPFAQTSTSSSVGGRFRCVISIQCTLTSLLLTCSLTATCLPSGSFADRAAFVESLRRRLRNNSQGGAKPKAEVQFDATLGVSASRAHEFVAASVSLTGVLRRAAAQGCLAATALHAASGGSPPAPTAAVPPPAPAPAISSVAPPPLPPPEEDLRVVPSVPRWDDLDTHDPDAALFAAAAAARAGGRLAPPRILVSAHAAVDGLTLALRLAHVSQARLIEPAALLQASIAAYRADWQAASSRAAAAARRLNRRPGDEEEEGGGEEEEEARAADGEGSESKKPTPEDGEEEEGGAAAAVASKKAPPPVVPPQPAECLVDLTTFAALGRRAFRALRAEIAARFPPPPPPPGAAAAAGTHESSGSAVPADAAGEESTAAAEAPAAPRTLTESTDVLSHLLHQPGGGPGDSELAALVPPELVCAALAAALVDAHVHDAAYVMAGWLGSQAQYDALFAELQVRAHAW